MNKCRAYIQSFKGKVVVALVIISLGCSYGIYSVKNLSDERLHDRQDQQSATCWSGYNGRSVLRAIIANSAGSGKIPTITDPQLRALLEASAKNGRQFKKFAFEVLPLPQCEGKNPDPLPQQVIDLAK